MSDYEIKEIEVCTQISTVIVASDLDDPEQAIANADVLWQEGQLTKSDNATSTFTSFLAHVSTEEDHTEPSLSFPEQLKIYVPLHQGALYQVRMTREYRRIKGESRWKLYSVDFTDAVKVGV